MNKTFHSLIALCAACLLLPMGSATAKEIDCEMRFDLSSWSVVYKSSSGQRVITCTNGQRMAVRLEARGGGLAVGKSRLEDGIGEFSGVHDISELLGTYASAEASAGSGAAAKGQVVTKGDVSLALSGNGKGRDLGIASAGSPSRAASRTQHLSPPGSAPAGGQAAFTQSQANCPSRRR